MQNLAKLQNIFGIKIGQKEYQEVFCAADALPFTANPCGKYQNCSAKETLLETFQLTEWDQASAVALCPEVGLDITAFTTTLSGHLIFLHFFTLVKSMDN